MSPSLAAIDANLLVALDVLLTERHVTRAAKRLGVTQSAMSQTLQRLRDALDDPLLVRSGPRMVATPRAEAIAGPLRAALQALTQTLAGPARFEPATSDRVFRVAMLDHSAYTMLPGLLSTLAKAGPDLQIEVLTLDLAVIWDQLRAGDVELAVIGPWQAPPDVMTEQLFMDHMTSMVRADHAILSGPITVERYTAWPHAVFRLTGRGGFAIDDLLAEVGAQRRVIAKVPYFLAAPALVANSDLIITAPNTAVRAFAEHWPLASFAPPLPLRPYAMSMAWPNFVDADEGHQWLRAALRAQTTRWVSAAR